MKTLICLKGNFEALPVIQQAHAMGLRLIVVDKAPDPAVYPLAEAVIVADAYDADATLQSLRYACPVLYSAGQTIDGVLCCCGDMPRTAALVAAEFHLPGMLQRSAKLSSDKLSQKITLRAAGLPVPDFHDWPQIVVKPKASRGARGVKLIKTGGMVERYISGPQLSTESIVQDGHVLFTAIGLRNYDRLAEFAPYMIEDGFDEPWGDAAIQHGIDALLERACRALDWYQHSGGTVKGDWIIHEGNLVILELAARLSGGFFSTHGHPLAYGVDFVDYAIGAAVGQKLHEPIERPGSFVCQRYVFPEPCDIGRRVKIINNSFYVATHTGTIEFRTYAIHPSDMIVPVISHGQRWGQAICTGDTPEQARERADQAVKAMKAAVVLE